VLKAVLGDAGAQRLADGLMHHVAGVGGSVTLGFLLAMVPVVSSFFGLTLDVRHVTLSFGSLAFAGCALGPSAVLQPDFLAALAGVGVIGLLNFGVSFALALGVALRARDVSTREALPFLRAALLRFARDPRSFLLPPRDTASDELQVSAPPAP
jgi:site-specific recombinase